MDELKTVCDRTLINGLNPEFKSAIDSLLACGITKADIRDAIATLMRKAGGDPHGPVGTGGLTMLAVDAYLESK